MLRLKEFLQAVDENTLCKVADINGKLLAEPLSVYEIAFINANFLEYHVIRCYIMNNLIYIFLDIDIRK